MQNQVWLSIQEWKSQIRIQRQKVNNANYYVSLFRSTLDEDKHQGPAQNTYDTECLKYWKQQYRTHCKTLRCTVACYLKAKKVDRDSLEWSSIDGKPEGGDYACKKTNHKYEPTKEKIAYYDKDNNISLPDINNNSNLVQENIIVIIFSSAYYLLPFVIISSLPFDIYSNQVLIDYLAELSYDMFYIDSPLELSNEILQLDCSSVTTDQVQVDCSLESTHDKLYINLSSNLSNEILDVSSSELSNEILSVSCLSESSDEVTNEFISNS